MFRGGATKACFPATGFRRAPFCESRRSRAASPRKEKNLGTTKKKRRSKSPDEQLANQVIIRKESKSYRMSDIQNLQTFDPFADATKGDDRLPAGTEDYIHIRIQQRNGRKTLTTVQGIAIDYDKKKLVKAFKKKFACNGTVIEHPEYGEVIQLQGDQRKNICQFLIEIGLAKEEQLKVHGF
uniref:Eukaryotic translation initiation factor 1 n=4 Tax=Cottioidei TaxID=8100 RepID=A0A8C2WFD4_CYCLU